MMEKIVFYYVYNSPVGHFTFIRSLIKFITSKSTNTAAMIKYILLSMPALIAASIVVSCNEKKIEWGPDVYVPDTTFKVVGYITARTPEKMDSLELDKLTHLNIAFANPDSTGQLICNKQVDITPFVEKGHAAGLKVFISLAGGGKPDTIIWHRLLLPENRNEFIGKIIDYVEKNKLDGVDVDIEGNLLPQVGLNYNPFVVELRQALHSKGKAITAALGATHFHQNVQKEALDANYFIKVMVYDKTRDLEAGRDRSALPLVIC
jgi:chitinase